MGWTRFVAGLAVATSVVGLSAVAEAIPTTTQVGLDTATCAQPWLPVYVHGTPPEVGPTPDWPTNEVPPPAGPSIDVAARGGQMPDTVGDGVPDAITNDDANGTVVDNRSSGQLVLTTTGTVMIQFTNLWIGDLDGDGRDELLVLVQPTSGPTHYVVVPGATPNGTHDADAVGIGGAITQFTGVGDQNGDGRDDVLSGTAVLSGAAVMAPGPGGILSPEPPPILTVPTAFGLGILALTPTTPPVFVTTAPGVGSDGAPETVLTLLTDPTVTLRTARLPGWQGGQGRPGGYLSDGHRIVTYATITTAGKVGALWMWDLDAPCAGPVLASTTTAPDPVAVSPSFTG